jgi:hypothetical protein
MIERRIAAMAIVVSSCLAIACAGDSSPVSPSATSEPPSTPIALSTVSGRVTGRATLLGVAGAKVTAQAGSTMGPGAVTDGSGYYSITGLKPGPLTVSVQAEDYVDRSETVEVAPNTTTIVNFQLMSAAED